QVYISLTLLLSITLNLALSPFLPYTTLFRSVLRFAGIVAVRDARIHRLVQLAEVRHAHAARSHAAEGDAVDGRPGYAGLPCVSRSEEHRLNSSHVKISYAVLCLK